MSTARIRPEMLRAALIDPPDHLRAIYTAMLDRQISFGFIYQSRGTFEFPTTGHPLVVILGDDLHQASGPEAFDEASTRALIEACDGFVIVSGAPEVDVYEMALQHAIHHRAKVIIVETRPEQEDAWIAFILATRPSAGVLVSTPFPDRPHLWDAPCAGGVH